MPPFQPGRTLAGNFFVTAVQPIIDSYREQLPYAAALLGPGSEVLGFDDTMSTDHHWGPRVMLFLEPKDAATAILL